MVLFSSIAASTVVLGATRAFGAPFEARDAADDSTFSIQQVANPGYKGFYTSGQAALAKAYAKYGATTPQYVTNAVNLAISNFQSQGSVVAQPERYDNAYLCPVKIGTPPQQVFLDFDTGSSDLWVFSTETPELEVNRQTLYNPSKSKSASKLEGSTWSIGYGDGSRSSGDVYIDHVSVGGVKVISQAVEAALNVSSSFTKDSASSGLLGLGFGNINTIKPNKQPTFFDNVKGVLDQALFTADLKNGKFGTYDFGYIDNNKKTGDISYVPVNSTKGFWAITGSGYAVGNASFVNVDIHTIVDTGTTLLLVDDDIVQDYYASVKGATFSTIEGGWIFPCENTTLPDFVFGAGDYRGRIPGEYMNYAPSDAKQYYCFGGIQSNSDIGFSIYGDILIKAQFVVFDGVRNRVGFAPKAL